MSKKKQKHADKELKAVVKKLRKQLAVAEKSAEKWRTRAKAHKSDVAGLKSELTAVRRKLAKAEASVEKWKGRARSAATATPDVVLTPVPTAETTAEPTLEPMPEPMLEPMPTPVMQTAASPETLPSSSAVEPDDSWTVTRLRAEARARGIAGYSRKSKDQLLTDLRD